MMQFTHRAFILFLGNSQKRPWKHCNSNIKCDTAKVYKVQVGSLLSRPPQRPQSSLSFSFWYLEWKWELDPWYSTCMYCVAESTWETSKLDLAIRRGNDWKAVRKCRYEIIAEHQYYYMLYEHHHLCTSFPPMHISPKGGKNHWHQWGKVLIPV